MFSLMIIKLAACQNQGNHTFILSYMAYILHHNGQCQYYSSWFLLILLQYIVCHRYNPGYMRLLIHGLVTRIWAITYPCQDMGNYLSMPGYGQLLIHARIWAITYPCPRYLGLDLQSSTILKPDLSKSLCFKTCLDFFEIYLSSWQQWWCMSCM